MIISQESVFWFGVKTLVAERTKFDLVAWETELDHALQRVRDFHPDVILIAEDNIASPTINILNQDLGTHVIAISQKENVLYHYHGKRQIVDDVEDLFRAIESATSNHIISDS
jgi:predicted P-loop ATPase/GTPase